MIDVMSSQCISVKQTGTSQRGISAFGVRCEEEDVD